MMKKILIPVVFLLVLDLNAQNYLITFAGSGESSTVGTVKVENLSKGTIIELNGSDILQLTGSTGIRTDYSRETGEIRIYPNPVLDCSFIEIDPPEAGNASITLYEITGKVISQSRFYLDAVKQNLRIEGLGKGLYLMDISGENYKLSGRLMGMGQKGRTLNISKIGSSYQSGISKNENHGSKGTAATVTMNYTTGDRLVFTGISGNYKTVITDVPSSDKTITFNFIGCTDGNGNNYSVVQIGSAKGDSGSEGGKGLQIWMGENLKTTKYNDGTDIPLVTADNITWRNLTTPAYCWYNNDPTSNADTYGALYNWHAVNTDKLCPAGWHVPSKNEWTALRDNLGGEKVAGGKLKESGTAHWYLNTGGTNETGFTALPGGARIYSLGFYYQLLYAFYWSSTRASNPDRKSVV